MLTKHICVLLLTVFYVAPNLALRERSSGEDMQPLVLMETGNGQDAEATSVKEKVRGLISLTRKVSDGFDGLNLVQMGKLKYLRSLDHDLKNVDDARLRFLDVAPDEMKKTDFDLPASAWPIIVEVGQTRYVFPLAPREAEVKTQMNDGMVFKRRVIHHTPHMCSKDGFSWRCMKISANMSCGGFEGASPTPDTSCRIKVKHDVMQPSLVEESDTTKPAEISMSWDVPLLENDRPLVLDRLTIAEQLDLNLYSVATSSKCSTSSSESLLCRVFRKFARGSTADLSRELQRDVEELGEVEEGRGDEAEEIGGGDNDEEIGESIPGSALLQVEEGLHSGTPAAARAAHRVHMNGHRPDEGSCGWKTFFLIVGIMLWFIFISHAR